MPAEHWETNEFLAKSFKPKERPSGAIVFIDTETTGFSHKTHEVIELAGVRWIEPKDDCKEEYQIFGHLLKPCLPVPEASIRVHGYTESFLIENGRSPKEVFQEFKDFVGDSWIAGHNVAYDKRMIESCARRHGIKIELKVAFDSLSIARKHLKSFPSKKLSFLSESFNLHEGLEFHGAVDDCLATIRLAKLFREKGWVKWN